MHELSEQRARRLLVVWRDQGPAGLRAAAGEGVRWPGACAVDAGSVDVVDATGSLVLLAGSGQAWIARFAGARLVEVSRVADEELGRELLAAGSADADAARLTLRERAADGVLHLTVGGELDFGTGDQLRDRLTQAEGVARVELDLSGVTFIDAAGLHAIVDAVRAAEQRGTVVEVVRSSPAVVRLAGLVDEPGLLPPIA